MEKSPPRWLRPAVDYGPLAAFFVVYLSAGLIPATIAVMAATGVALVLSLAIERRVPAGKVIHVILDNYAAHKHPNVRYLDATLRTHEVIWTS